ncbi:hypothetical protein ACOXVJ_16530 [Pseudomonas knackmussii]|uniref:hypothetical protein n=1 Tax=Pseudomonas knackmussii TaxID=65741 RepID=UPI003BDB12B3
MTLPERKEVLPQEQTPRRGKALWPLLAPLATAAAMPVFYLNGKVYHESYLGFFKLEPSLFPQDTSSTLISAVLGWFHASLYGIRGTLGMLENHYGALFGALLCLLLLGPLNVLLKRLGQKLDEGQPRTRRPLAGAEYIKEAGRLLIGLFAVFYAILSAMLLIAIVFVLCVGPFASVARKVAAEDFAAGFKNSPQVTLTDPRGKTETFRIIECSPLFCALFADGRAISVPLSRIDWAESDRPEQR